MMYELKQSDSGIVVMKSANKGSREPAEPMERRAETERNSRRRSMHRTQGRGRVSPGAERIRQAATRKPKERLTALLHHITPQALRAAYFSLKRNAAAGVDGMIRVTTHPFSVSLGCRFVGRFA